MTQFPVGTKVRFAHPHGSIGEVTGHYLGYNSVTWNYGKSLRGEALQAFSHMVRTEELERVSGEFYGKYVNCRAWSEEQKKLRVELLA